jgi:hypothetical protein
VGDAEDLRSLRYQLTAAHDSLSLHLIDINAWLASGGPAPAAAFIAAADDIAEIRFVLSSIEKLTGELEHPHRRKK